MTLSVVILTLDAEATLGRTLDSVAGLADEVFCVDSGSRDRTAEIARAAGATVVEHPFEHYGAQRNWAIDNLPLTGDWELHLDADERLTPELAIEIRGLLDGAPAALAGCYLPRLVHFHGQPLRHGGMYPIWHLRLFRRGRGRCEDRLYDQHFYVEGPTERLSAPMIDDMRGSFAVWKARHRRWARLEAEQLRRGAGPRPGVIAGRFGGSPVERKRALRRLYEGLPPLVRPFLLFAYRFLLRGGFRDGWWGWRFYWHQTLCFRLLIDWYLVKLRLERDPIRPARPGR
ncbi:Glycosyltransferase involved in cell wall bisynthesis [Tistlia consotensis]|uniref:Glycosyltransferase involved in cell wall bisynthesis n=1 Tax=Tistlia consotensis USBA 355 TaxID=560819 RepID=A0A1Y6CGV8_9PROT|nr:glycosyltransferase family 2 protein [Tistlia consotensis]SMF63223.1 Glycosyltransferase involved in cell wall bisynthesis [Tistlia consotensis USBA 355]SNR95891.1 Glycosyltransferase involved in cell wall bisynthesis [Tistlia consotensis]